VTWWAIVCIAERINDDFVSLDMVSLSLAVLIV